MVRIKKPTKLKILQGNPGKRPLPKDEPMPDGDAVFPSWLPKSAREHWDKISPELTACSILTGIDGIALGMLSNAIVNYIEAQTELDKNGKVISAPSGYPVQSPWVSIQNKAHDQIIKICMQFGMTPASRASVKTAPKKKENAFDKLKK